MISLDWSIVPAIIIFALLVVALNYLFFKPLFGVQEERERRTTGLIEKTRKNLAHYLHLFDQYQATIKNARLEGYRLLEEARDKALAKRSDAMARAKGSAEAQIRESRDSIHTQVETAKEQLRREAEEMASRIAATILQRSA